MISYSDPKAGWNEAKAHGVSLHSPPVCLLLVW